MLKIVCDALGCDEEHELDEGNFHGLPPGWIRIETADAIDREGVVEMFKEQGIQQPFIREGIGIESSSLLAVRRSVLCPAHRERIPNLKPEVPIMRTMPGMLR